MGFAAPTEEIDVQKTYLFNEYGEKDAFPEGLHEINLDELIYTAMKDYPDLSVFDGDATYHTDDEGYSYLEDGCGFVHRVPWQIEELSMALSLRQHGVLHFKAVAQADGSVGRAQNP